MSKTTGEYGIGLGLVLADEVDTSTTVGRVDVDLTLSLREGRYVCIRFAAYPTVENIAAGVTGEDLREVAIGELIEASGRDRDVEEAIRTTGRRVIEEEGGLTDKSLEVVATAYRYGYAIGDSPTREVVDLLGLTRSKASRWIAEAREDGVLGGTSERQAGGVLGAVEQLRDRVRALTQEEARMTHLVDLRREEVDRAAIRAASTSMEDAALGVMPGQREEEERAARSRLEDQYDDLAIVKARLDAAREELARAEREAK